MASYTKGLVDFPLNFRKLICTKITQNFREAITLKTASISLESLKPNDVVVRNKYVGINASDINVTAGRYGSVKPPFDIGMESLGEVVWAGEKCSSLKLGDPVGINNIGSFSEYLVLPERRALHLPSLKPEYLALVISGATASISLEELGDLKPKEKVLVTAAAGGTGQFAVQLAALAGCHVIGTCSSDEKAEFLRSLGCNRPINYLKENVGDVLRKEYPQGINVVYESMGGDIFSTCVRNLAVRGRLIVIGMITDYQKESFKVVPTVPIQQLLLSKSASLRGFFLIHYMRELPGHIERLAKLEAEGKLTVKVDLGSHLPGGPFKELTSVPDAVDYLYTRQSKGKIVVSLHDDPLSKL